MLKRLNNALKYASVILLATLIMSGCGEQALNETSEEILDSDAEISLQNFGNVILPGKAIKGVIQNANVAVYVINHGAISNERLATAQTNINGEFSVKIPRKHARCLLYLELTANNSDLSPTLMTCDAYSGCGQINGDTVQFGDSFALGSDFLLRNIVKLEGHEEFMPAHFSPLRHMVVAQVEASSDGFTWSNVDSSGAYIAQLFSLETPIHKLTPVDLTGDAKALYLASDEEIIAAIIDASFLNIGESPNYKSVEQVLDDLTLQQGVLAEGAGTISASEVMLAASSNIPNTLTNRTSVASYFSAGGEDPMYYALSVGLNGKGVVSGNNDINCSTLLCEYNFSENTLVSVSAMPAQGYEFDHWEGLCATSTSSTCAFTINSNSQTTAVFTAIVVVEPSYYSLNIGISGSGAVRNSEETIICTSGTCSKVFIEGASQTLSATPAQGFEFDRWEVQCAGSTSPSCALTILSDVSIIAIFKEVIPEPTYYSLNTSITGAGAVQNISNNINCSSATCSTSLLQDTSLTLMATPENGYEFNHWELSCNGSTSSECLISMNSDIVIKAVFTELVVQSGVINVSWSAPTEREDGTVLASNEIKQYTIYFRESLDQPYEGATSMVVVDDGSGNIPTSLIIEGLVKGKSYYLAGITIDSNDITSQLSNEIVKVVQ
ncbi:MAG: hypothetical protein JKY01_07385 [Pseudomonadales bacterium]|nr:hypothetical protein [Pseudomonadales bacterium]